MDDTPVDKVFFRLLYILKRLTDNWADTQFPGILEGFKNAYLPVLMCIHANGISNNEIAGELHISKMAVSKVVKELEKLALISGQKDKTDRRSERLFLTEKGKLLVKDVKTLSAGLIAEYESILGKEKYQQLIESMLALRHFHESLSGGEPK